MASRIVVSSNESTLANDRLFCGRQPDDFAISALVGSPRDICMLGVALGGAFNAIAALAPDARLVGVERDEDMLAACRALQRTYYPHLDFDLVAADATEFLADHVDAFDAINVDLYHADAYSPQYFDPKFWTAVRGAMRADGVLIVNAMGFPEHLVPLKRDTAQARVGQWLTSVWPHVVALPNRRNTTFIASSSDVYERLVHPAQADAFDSLTDRALVRAIAPRLSVATPLTANGVGAAPFATHMTEIDAEFLRLLPGFVDDLIGAGGPPTNADEHPGSYVRRLMLDPDTTIAVTMKLLEEGSELAAFGPACFASYRAEGRREYDWVVDWLAENLSDLDAAHPLWTRQIAVWQVLTALANPFTGAPVGANKLLAAIDEVYPKCGD